MSNEVTLQEVRDELARFPQVMMMPGDPRISDFATTITLYDLHRAQGEFPKLMGFLELARQHANAYSSLDSKIPQVDYVEITNVHSRPIASVISNRSGKRELMIRTDMLLGMPHEMALAMLTHEYKHVHDHARGLLSSLTKEQHHSLEYAADRSVKAPLAISIALLGLMTSEEFSSHYYRISTDSKYPPLRNRIMASLESAYGNMDFRDSGYVEADGRFYPKRQDFLPVLENGRKVLNWDAELQPKIRAMVIEDMQYIDNIVGLKADPIQSNDIKAFLNHVLPRIKSFQQMHHFDLEAPTNEYLARQFELALEIPVRREGVMHMHEKMPAAFKAYDEAVQNANHFVTPFAQDAVINNARQHIVDGIRQGNYPEVKQSPEVKQLQDVSKPFVIKESHQENNVVEIFQ